MTCQQEEWELSCAAEHTWVINFNNETTLSSQFETHGGKYDWYLCLQSKQPKIERTFGGIDHLSVFDSERLGNYYRLSNSYKTFENYILQLSLQNFKGKHPSTLEKKKIEIEIVNANGFKDYENIKKEVCVDKENTTFSIHYSNDEESEIDGFYFINCDLNLSLTILVKVFDITKKSLDDNFARLLKSGVCSDFKIIMDEKEFLVHKCILAARSDYFSAMFRDKIYKESTEGAVKINDIRVEVMNEMLRFIYCGKADITAELSYDLLTAADMYAIKPLKLVCEKKIVDNLTVENLGECIKYADLYHDEYLQEVARNFLTNTKNSGYKFGADEIEKLKSNLSSVSSSYLTSLICDLIL